MVNGLSPFCGIGEKRIADNQCIGISRGDRSTKIHEVVDAPGNPINVMLSAGNIKDTVAEKPVSQIDLNSVTVLGRLEKLSSPPDG